MQVPLEKKAVLTVKCLSCGCSLPLQDLRPDVPYALPNPAGGNWPVTYHHCPCGKILVYEPGDGGDLVLLENVEIVAT